MSVSNVINSYRRGKLAEQCDDYLRQIVQGVYQTGQKGTLTIKLTIKPGEENRVVLEASVNPNVPVPALGEANFFADDKGELHRSDPRQQEMFNQPTHLAAVEN